MKTIGLRILAVLAPPLVVRVIGTKRQFGMNLALTACMYIPGSLHALYIACQQAK
jgi:uncharacterized membrane protein YqaE (UPF0057 family)